MFFELIVRGVAVGLIYALMGVGLALVQGVMKVINFAHGEFYMIGGYLAYFCIASFGLPWYLGVPVAMILTFAIGAIVEIFFISPIYSGRIENPMNYTLILTFGLLLAFRQLARQFFGPFYRRPQDYISGDIYIFGV
ncbi:MAG: branched-chain amino acid ABC transporter permease, partial [Deltaproteobacteria bacterium]|nr:branched-chain amino acid ABC transporter permease [Deltaproteobacteria bacterium]